MLTLRPLTGFEPGDLVSARVAGDLDVLGSPLAAAGRDLLVLDAEERDGQAVVLGHRPVQHDGRLRQLGDRRSGRGHQFDWKNTHNVQYSTEVCYCTTSSIIQKYVIVQRPV